MRRQLVLLSGLLLAALLCAALPAAAAPLAQETPTPAPLTGDGVIRGVVTNATTGAPAAGLEVTLGIFSETEWLDTRTALTDESGAYRVDGLPADAGLAFAVRVTGPGGVTYGSDIMTFEAQQTELDLPVTIYDTTDDPAGITAELMHYIVEFEAGHALVREVAVLGLSGNRAYTGDGKAVLAFTLPAGSSAPVIDGDEGDGRFQTTASGFIDTMPLAPGAGVRQLSYVYAVPYDGQALDLAWTLPYATARINVLVSDVGQRVSSQLDEQEQRRTDSGAYFVFSGANLPAGGQVLVQLSNLPATTGAAMAASPESSTTAAGSAGFSPVLFWILVGAAAIAAALLVALPLVRRGRLAAASAETRGDRDALLDALARLQSAHEAGAEAEEAYHDQRLRLKAQLRDLSGEKGSE